MATGLAKSADIATFGRGSDEKRLFLTNPSASDWTYGDLAQWVCPERGTFLREVDR
jgi:hypothetical protein